MAEERKKLYEAIGYSENAQLATYAAEVCMQLIHDYYCIVLCMFQYVAQRLNFDLQQVSLTLNNEEGRLVNYIATSVVISCMVVVFIQTHKSLTIILSSDSYPNGSSVNIIILYSVLPHTLLVQCYSYMYNLRLVDQQVQLMDAIMIS